MQSNPGAIFVGITPPQFRDYTFRLLQAARGPYSRVVAPCVGRLTIPHLAVAAGWEARQIEASDISLFSTVLGYCAAGKDLSELNVQVHGEEPWLQPQGEGLQYAAETLFAQKFLTLDTRSHYGQAFAQEMRHNRDVLLVQLAQQIQTIAEKLSGIAYEAADLWDVIEAARDAPRAIIALNPPTYSGGYTKLFDTHGALTWDEPRAAQFDHTSDTQRLHDLLMSCQGLTLMMKGEALQGIPEHHVVCAAQVNAKRTDFLLANKPELARELYGISARPQPDLQLKQPQWPPLQDADPIPAGAAVEMVLVDEATATYFRELWAHAMPPSGSSFGSLFLLVIDGRAAMLLRTSAPPTSAFWEGCGYLWWGIVPKSRRRLQRLGLACAMTTTFRDLAFKSLPEKERLRSTCFSRHPQVNSYRGLFELVQRDPGPGGSYKLLYEAPFRPGTWAECFSAWYQKEAQRLGSDTL